MLAIKLKYSSSQEFQIYLQDLRRQQSVVFRSAYNRFCESKTENQTTEHIRSLKGIEKLDTWLRHCGVMQAQALYKSVLERNNQDPKKVIFGTKRNFIKRCKGQITKSHFKTLKLNPLYITGEARVSGNRKIRLDFKNNKILFKNNRNKIKFDLNVNLPKREQLKQLLCIEKATKQKTKPLTVRIDENFITLIFEPFKKEKQEQIKNRVIAIDTNPNSIGWSIVEVFDNSITKIVDTGIIDVTKLNNKKVVTNKKHYEIFQINKFLIKKALHYKCSKFVVEDLHVVAKNHNKGRNINRIINNKWNRYILFQNLGKRCFIENIDFIKINPAYTSVIGATIYKDYPDPISPTFEIARRGCFKYQKDKFYPKIPSVDILNEQWKQTLKSNFESWKDLSEWLKNTKLTYRVTLNKHSKFYSLFHPKSLILSYYGCK
jgi:IS605 OrfB family transposase